MNQDEYNIKDEIYKLNSTMRQSKNDINKHINKINMKLYMK